MADSQVEPMEELGLKPEKYESNEEYQENQARLNDFLQMSLHMAGEFSGNSEQNQENQYKHEDESDETDGSGSSSNEDDVQCEICKKIFLDEDDLGLHIKSRRMHDKRYMCCNCNKTFRDNTQLKVHARKHTGEKPFECNICSKKFTVNGNLNKHMRIHTGEKRFECSDCGRKFTQFAHLEDHLKTHSGEKPFVCSYCQGAFKTKARLKKHEKSHTDGKPSKRAVSCPKCNITLKSNRQLATHLVTHVQDTDGPFICHFCGKVFSKYFNLQEHQLNHADLKSFICSCCDKVFTNASHLRRHMNSHSGFRPYSCVICKRPFPSSQNLKRHMMTHTGEKPFTCTECNRGFLTLENLNRHRRTHTGEKPFACEICGKLFAHSTTAKEHYRTVHTGEKPYGCPLCFKNFAISKMLYKHIRERHPKYFPQFKKEQSLTPNMKKAQEKIRMGIKIEDEIKTEDCASDKGSEDTEIALKYVKIKEEPIDEDDICDSDFYYKVDENKFKTESPIVPVGSSDKNESKVKSEIPVKREHSENSWTESSVEPEQTDLDIPFVKVEKEEGDEV